MKVRTQKEVDSSFKAFSQSGQLPVPKAFIHQMLYFRLLPGHEYFHTISCREKKKHIKATTSSSHRWLCRTVSNFPASDRPQDVASGQSPPGCRCSVLLDEIQASARDPWTLPSNVLYGFSSSIRRWSLPLCSCFVGGGVPWTSSSFSWKAWWREESRFQLLRVSRLNILFDLYSCVFVTNLHQNIVFGTFCEHLISTKDFGKTLTCFFFTFKARSPSGFWPYKLEKNKNNR